MGHVLKPRGLAALTLALIGALATPALAQSDDNAGEAAATDDGTLVIDIKAATEERELDPLLEQRCAEIADAARVANEILVCRELGETTDGSYNHADFIRRYAEATQGPKTPDVDGTGLPLGMTPLVTVRGCFIPPCPGEPALLIDVTALPKAPPGSDADRIARGLPPLGPDGDDGRGTGEDELGLPPPPDFAASEE